MLLHLSCPRGHLCPLSVSYALFSLSLLMLCASIKKPLPKTMARRCSRLGYGISMNCLSHKHVRLSWDLQQPWKARPSHTVLKRLRQEDPLALPCWPASLAKLVSHIEKENKRRFSLFPTSQEFYRFAGFPFKV